MGSVDRLWKTVISKKDRQCQSSTQPHRHQQKRRIKNIATCDMAWVVTSLTSHDKASYIQSYAYVMKTDLFWNDILHFHFYISVGKGEVQVFGSWLRKLISEHVKSQQLQIAESGLTTCTASATYFKTLSFHICRLDTLISHRLKSLDCRASNSGKVRYAPQVR